MTVNYIGYFFRSNSFRTQAMLMASRNTQWFNINQTALKKTIVFISCQAYHWTIKKLGMCFSLISNSLITLHQRGLKMKGKMKKTDILLYKYFQSWINVYKRGSIRKVSFMKYELTLDWIIKLAPNLKLSDLDRVSYQQIINDYAECHERQTTMDFHHHLKGCLLECFRWRAINKRPYLGR